MIGSKRKWGKSIEEFKTYWTYLWGNSSSKIFFMSLLEELFTREKASSKPVLFSQRPFSMLFFPFSTPESSVFIWMSTQLSTEEHWLTFCQFSKRDWTVWFLSWQLLQCIDVIFPSVEDASLILAQVSSSSLLLVLSSSSLNFNSCLISSANFSRGLSKWRLLVGRETSLVFSIQCNLCNINVNYLLLLLALPDAFYALRRS